MPIVRDGEKYACKQCIQGHRVSGCNHTDRPLLHVNKKGRPVSQCPHCRGLRKARQTHVKCDCGERRHSRNNSSESASLDESGCTCYAGKKCTCALKKDTSDTDSSKNFGAPSPETDRNSPMRWIPARRSESAMPKLRGSPVYKRHGSQDLGLPYNSAAQRPYQLGRSHHAAQRSVDSLPLAAYATAAQYQAPATGRAYDTQFLMPDNVMPPMPTTQSTGSPFCNAMAGDFPIPLDQTTIDRTLSPHNTKRYSMNDFSMLAGMSQHMPGPNLFPTNPNDAQPFPFPDLSNQDLSFPDAMNEQGSRIGSVTSNDAPYPALSRSSSGTVSEPLDWVFAPNENKSGYGQPVITIDPTWNFQTFEASSEKSAYDFTPSSYQGTPSEYTSPFDDPALPAYRPENFHEDLNPFSTEPRFGGMNDFPFPGQEGTQNLMGEHKTGNMSVFQVLPDRSAQIPSAVPEHVLDTEFKFPAHDFTMDGFAGSPLKQGWSPYSDNENME